MRIVLAMALAFFLLHTNAKANEMGHDISYYDGETELEGYWISSQCNASKAEPLIIIIPQWKGISAHEKDVGEKLAWKCNNVLIADMYGKGIRPKNNVEAATESAKYKNNPSLGRQRITAALNFGKEKGKAEQVAVLGYCFGGTMALELARSGADIAGVISFHGGLGTVEPATQPGSINASVLIHHGDADPLVPTEEIKAFQNEMRKAKADWVFTRYADAVHAFTQKEAGDDPSQGVAYNEKADTRSWETTLNFLNEIIDYEQSRR